MLVIGLTGISGSGKSYVCSILRRPEFEIIDADRLYHKMISIPSKCTSALSLEFGNGIINSDGGIDRKKLSRIVFSDKEKLNRLNSITHSLIIERFHEIISASAMSGKKAVIIDAPTLFESGFDSECDLTVGVICSPELRLSRIIDRDLITEEEAIRRISNQKDESFFIERCDHILENNCSDDLYTQCEDLVAEIMRLYEKKKKES